MATKKHPKMTLADLKPTSIDMELIHPTKGATGIMLKIVGQDSVQFRQLSKGLMKNRLEQGKDTKIDVDQLEKDNAALAAACIVGWDEGVFGPYTADKAVEYMIDPELAWIREQVESFVKTRSNFFR
jgi:hypothetical protein